MRQKLALLLGFARADNAITLIASSDRRGKLQAAYDTAAALPDTYRAVAIVDDISADLDVTNLVLPPAINSVAPAITGTAQVGHVLTTTNGTWNRSPSFTRQWKADGVNIAGAVGTTYTPVAGDVGKVITCLVTALTAGGTSTHLSNVTAAIIA